MKLFALLALSTLALPVHATIEGRAEAAEAAGIELAASREEALKSLRVVGERVSWDRAGRVVYFSITYQNDSHDCVLAASVTARTLYTRPGSTSGPKVDERTESILIKPGQRVTFVGKLMFEAPPGAVARLELPDPAKHPELIRRAALLEPTN